MSITTDWHIHTHCSCDSASMKLETLIQEAQELGISDFGISDHYHTRIQEPDIAASRREYDAVLEKHPQLRGHFHFGIEATLVSSWEVAQIAGGKYEETPVYGLRVGGPANAPVILDFDEGFLERYGIEYVVTGMHWPMYCATDPQSLIKEYHRQYLYAATHPYTTIMAHYLWWDDGLLPNWWGVKGVENPFLDFSVISQTMRSELKAALLEHQTAFEINLSTVVFDKCIPDSFRDEYLGWAADLQRSGVVLSIGSDCHSAHLNGTDYTAADKILTGYGIDTDACFKL